MKLIDKHFKQDNILHKIFNRKTLKISYSCTKNISQIINNHNKEIIKEFQNRANNNNNSNSKQIEYNCKSRSDCPMNGLWNLDNVVYQGIIYPKEDINDRKTYIAISSTKWKIRYGNHKYSFSHEHLRNQTALSKHFWGVKNKGLTPEIQWSMFLPGSGHIDTAIWMHYMDANKTAGEETRWQLHKNAACNPQQVLAATPHKTPTVRPPAPYHENYSS